jgi:hypothetical protein
MTDLKRSHCPTSSTLLLTFELVNYPSSLRINANLKHCHVVEQRSLESRLPGSILLAARLMITSLVIADVSALQPTTALQFQGLALVLGS